MAAEQTYKIVPVLIHGTFSPNAEWVQEDSQLSKMLKDNFPDIQEIRQFYWDGNNSHKSRIQAGQDLSSQLLSWHKECPEERYMLIGHSHGGNIAMYSLHETKHLTLSIVTMSTPFIEAKKRDLDQAVSVFGLMTWLLKASFLAVLILGVVGLIGYSFMDNMTGILTGIALFIVVVAGLAMLFGEDIFDSMFGSFLEAKEIAETEDAISSSLAIEQESRYQFLSTPFLDKVPLLSLRTKFDEVEWWLKSMVSISNFPYAFWSTVTGFLAKYGIAFFLLVMVAAVIAEDHANHLWTIRHWSISTAFMVIFMIVSTCLASVALTAVFIIIQLFMLLIPKILRAHMLVFGGEKMMDNWLLDISAEPFITKEESSFIENRVIEVQDEKWYSLNHSHLYQNEEALNTIVNWTRNHLNTSRFTGVMVD